MRRTSAMGSGVGPNRPRPWAAAAARFGRPGAPWSRGTEAGFGLVEAMIAIVILSVGLLAVAGLSVTVIRQTRIAQVQTEQALAGQQVLERMHRAGYDAAASGVDTVTIDGRAYAVTVTVTQATSRVKDVQAQVSGIGNVGAQAFHTRLYQPRALPDPPTP